MVLYCAVASLFIYVRFVPCYDDVFPMFIWVFESHNFIRKKTDKLAILMYFFLSQLPQTIHVLQCSMKARVDL